MGFYEDIVNLTNDQCNSDLLESLRALIRKAAEQGKNEIVIARWDKEDSYEKELRVLSNEGFNIIVAKNRPYYKYYPDVTITWGSR